MKKSVLAGVAAFLVGAALFLTGYRQAGYDLSAVNMDYQNWHVSLGGVTYDADAGETVSAEGGEQTLSARGVERVKVEAVAADVTLEESPDGLLHLLLTGDWTLEEGKTLTLREKTRRGIWFGGVTAPGAFLVLRVPRDLALDYSLETVSGGVVLNLSRAGTVELETVSGDVTAVGLALQKSGRFESVSGDVDLALTGEGLRVKAESVSGEKRVAEAFASGGGGVSVSVSTVSGDIRVRPAG